MPKQETCRIAIVDDHRIFSESLRLTIETFPFVTCTDIYHTADDLLLAIKENVPDIVLMDIEIKNSSLEGIQATKQVLQYHPGIKVIAVSAHDDGYTVGQMLDAGASAYFTKDLDVMMLREAMEAVYTGKNYISPRAAENYTNLYSGRGKHVTHIHTTKEDFSKQELEIMELAARGKMDKEIAQLLGITHKVVEYEKSKIFKKLEVRNATEMVRVAIRLRLISQ